MIIFKENQPKNFLLNKNHTDKNIFLILKQLGIHAYDPRIVLSLIRSTHFNVFNKDKSRFLETVSDLDQCCVCTLFFNIYTDLK